MLVSIRETVGARFTLEPVAKPQQHGNYTTADSASSDKRHPHNFKQSGRALLRRRYNPFQISPRHFWLGVSCPCMRLPAEKLMHAAGPLAYNSQLHPLPNDIDESVSTYM